MKQISLEALGLNLEYNGLNEYFYHGEVDDCVGFSRRFGLGYGKINPKDRIYGTTIFNPQRREIHTFIKRGLSFPSKTFILGHEESHVVEHLNMVLKLMSQMKKAGYSGGDLRSLKTEVCADLAGIHALGNVFGFEHDDEAGWEHLFYDIQEQTGTDIDKLQRYHKKYWKVYP